MLTSAARADFAAEAIAANCTICHARKDGDVGMPALADLSAEKLRQSLLDFKYDRKTATLMNRIAKGYSDTELAVVADYLGKR
ncbi:c-type cytochrome [Methylomonas sp. CM2]|uniref:c-type cytochrome n=1 Tax=Methylomonas sp. CM2 TaxID=3417647 RepID=UPI003CF6DC56